jgi:NAD(P)-dependent dehydrogenase (short-subunit alcohol dehydrogenase family)
LITGGGTGIGRAIAIALAGAGAHVAITGRRRDVLEETAAEIEGRGGEALCVPGDVSRPRDTEATIQAVTDRFDTLHILVNNAGVARGGPIEGMSTEDIDLVVDVDLKGPIYMIRSALPWLREHRNDGGAAVLNVGSSVTLGPIKNFSVYSAAKAGLDMITRCLALELASDGIRVNAVCPGIVRTPIFETMMPSASIEGFLEGFEDAVPLGRVATPEDVASLALSLLHPDGSYVTGAVIPVDGGLSLSADGKS